MARIPINQASDNARQQISGRLSGGAGPTGFGSGVLTSGRISAITLNPTVGLMRTPQQRQPRLTPLTEGFTQPAFGPAAASAATQGLGNIVTGYMRAQDQRKKQEAFDEALLIDKEVRQWQIADAEFFDRYSSFPPTNISDLYQQHHQERLDQFQERYESTFSENGLAVLYGEINKVSTQGMVKSVGIGAQAKAQAYVAEFNQSVRETQLRLLSSSVAAPADELAKEVGALQKKLEQGKEARAYSEGAAKVLEDSLADLQVIVGIGLAEQGRVDQAQKILEDSLFSLSNEDRNKIRSAIKRTENNFTKEEKVKLRDQAEEAVAFTTRTGELSLADEDFTMMQALGPQFVDDLREDLRIARQIFNFTEDLRAEGPEVYQSIWSKFNANLPTDESERAEIERGISERIKEHSTEWRNERIKIAWEDKRLNTMYNAWITARDNGLPEAGALGHTWREAYIVWQKSKGEADKDVEVVGPEAERQLIANLNGNLGDPGAFLQTVTQIQNDFPLDHGRRLINQLARGRHGSELEGLAMIYLGEDDPNRLQVYLQAANTNPKDTLKPDDTKRLDQWVTEDPSMEELQDSFDVSVGGDKMTTAYRSLLAGMAAMRTKSPINEGVKKAVDKAAKFLIDEKFEFVDMDAHKVRLPKRGVGFDFTMFDEKDLREVLSYKLDPEGGRAATRQVLEAINADDLSDVPLGDDRATKADRLEQQAYWYPETEGLVLAIDGTDENGNLTGLSTPWRTKDGEYVMITWQELAAQTAAIAMKTMQDRIKRSETLLGPEPEFSGSP